MREDAFLEPWSSYNFLKTFGTPCRSYESLSKLGALTVHINENGNDYCIWKGYLQNFKTCRASVLDLELPLSKYLKSISWPSLFKQAKLWIGVFEKRLKTIRADGTYIILSWDYPFSRSFNHRRSFPGLPTNQASIRACYSSEQYFLYS